MIRFTSLVTALFIASPAYSDSPIKVSDGYIFETPKTAKAGAGYVTLTNTGTQDDSLIGAEADFPRVMLHDMETKDGVARMFHIHALEIPAGGQAKLEPGHAHVMFMGIDGDPFEEGEMIPVKLIFKNSEPQEIMMHVRKRGAHGAGHGNHGASHSNHGSD